VSTFEFAGLVDYDVPKTESAFPAAGSSLENAKK
jgi:hypothetical protein